MICNDCGRCYHNDEYKCCPDCGSWMRHSK
jgi:hypothetical protein